MILPDRDVLVGILEYSPAIVVYIKIVWRREHCYYGWKLFSWRLAEHGVSIELFSEYRMHTNSVILPRVLCLMRSNDTQKLIPR